MKIKLSPVRVDAPPLRVTVQDQDTVVINGDVFDFSPLQAGDTLPLSAIRGAAAFVSDIERDLSGELHFTLRLPHGRAAPQETRFPAAYATPVHIVSGELPIPPYDEDLA